MASAWFLTPEEMQLISSKYRKNQLGFAVWLVFFREHGYFPNHHREIDVDNMQQLSEQLEIPYVPEKIFDFTDRTAQRMRAEIRKIFGFREATVKDAEHLSQWLQTHILAQIGDDIEAAMVQLQTQCKKRCLEPPTLERLERIARNAITSFEDNLQSEVIKLLSDDTKTQLNSLLQPDEDNDEKTSSSPAMILKLKSNPGRPSLAGIEAELNKVKIIQSIQIPSEFSQVIPASFVKRYHQRVLVESPFELRRHAEALRFTMITSFLSIQSTLLIDDLVDLLIETIHQIGARAERKVEKALLKDLKRVSGKHNLLFEMADAVLEKPDNLVREVVYPVVNEQTLKDLVNEWKSTGPKYKVTLRTVIRNSYKGHYRRMVPKLLKTLAFHSNNDRHRPVMNALELVKCYADSKIQYYPSDEQVPLEGVARGLWKEAVIEQDAAGNDRINRITYEITVLEALREQLRCKEIWVTGANRYRNPDQDLPADFDCNRDDYYQALNLPQDAQSFTQSLQNAMQKALQQFDTGVKDNSDVRITTKKDGWISLSPLDAQAAPPHLAALKKELNETWPMTSLLDMIKETDMRLDFTQAFKSPTSHESLNRNTLQERLLLCLHGMGTNSGLQRMASLDSGITSKDLKYVRNRYLTDDNIRRAIAIITNGTLQTRNPDIWGDGTTACASDSKHYGAWDQNLTTQWHVRYGGRGVMIYWHVDRNSLCIHSQLKSPSSSEVASMIEGVLHHCSEMEIDRQYVDSHGQSTVAFAFCHLLGFKLLPRLKNIYSQKLYRPETGKPQAFKNLQLILTRPIDWLLIQQQYDEMVKYATALRLGTAQTESILRRFTRKNVQHPTYKALAELGRVIKTTFLCQYLNSKALRREIHEGLNMVEQWNGATDFVFFARRGEMSSNRSENHKTCMLSLHLIQNCMVYINTLMIQKLLSQPHWQGKFTPRDYAALTPLIWEHINPYGRFELDMSKRLNLH